MHEAGAPSPENQQARECLTTYTESYNDWLALLGLPPMPMSKDMAERISRLKSEEAESLAIRVVNSLRLMEASFPEVASEVRAGRTGFSKQSEVASLKRALSRADLRLADDHFFDVIDEGDIIEVFSIEGVQLYRSWSSYQYCSYSALELKLYDWDELYMRPSWVAKTLWEMLPQVLMPGAKTLAYDIPEYVMTERLHKQKRALLFKMKYVSPLVSISEGRTTAFVSTGALKVLKEASPNPDILIL